MSENLERIRTIVVSDHDNLTTYPGVLVLRFDASLFFATSSSFADGIRDHVQATDQPVIELETDKATIEVPSPFAGKIIKVQVNEGDRIQTGQLLVVIEATETPNLSNPIPPAPPKKSDEDVHQHENDTGHGTSPKKSPPQPGGHHRETGPLDSDRLPIVKTAQKKGFGCADLSRIHIVGDDYADSRCSDFCFAQLTPLDFSLLRVCKSVCKQVLFLIKSAFARQDDQSPGRSEK